MEINVDLNQYKELILLFKHLYCHGLLCVVTTDTEMQEIFLFALFVAKYKCSTVLQISKIVFALQIFRTIQIFQTLILRENSKIANPDRHDTNVLLRPTSIPQLEDTTRSSLSDFWLDTNSCLCRYIQVPRSILPKTRNGNLQQRP